MNAVFKIVDGPEYTSVLRFSQIPAPPHSYQISYCIVDFSGQSFPRGIKDVNTISDLRWSQNTTHPWRSIFTWPVPDFLIVCFSRCQLQRVRRSRDGKDSHRRPRRSTGACHNSSCHFVLEGELCISSSANQPFCTYKRFLTPLQEMKSTFSSLFNSYTVMYSDSSYLCLDVK